jgi:hypothetical protein
LLFPKTSLNRKFTVLKNCTIKSKWNFKRKGELIYIQTDSTKRVLGTSNGIKVIEEEFQEGKSEQPWKIGGAMALHHTLQKAVCNQPYMWPTNAEFHFTLENSKFPKLLTAITPFNLRLEGNFEMDKIRFANNNTGKNFVNEFCVF